MRRNGDLARDYAQRHGIAKWYDDGATLINDPDVDAVCIATPPYAHKDYTLMCAAAGKPVYVEKPMAMTFAECESMIAACRAANVPLWVAYYRRLLPRFLKVSAGVTYPTEITPSLTGMHHTQPSGAVTMTIVAGSFPTEYSTSMSAFVQ